MNRKLAHYRRKALDRAYKSPAQAVIAQLILGLAAALLMLIAFEGLSEVVIEGETRQLDEAVLLWINGNLPGWLYPVMLFITSLGYYWVVGIIGAFCCLLFYRAGRPLSAVLLATSAAGSAAITTVLKLLYGRARPELFETGYSASSYAFPSGHATVAVGFYGVLAILVCYRLTGPARWLVAAGSVTFILLMGLSRLYLGVHYPSDVLAGYLAASLWAVAVGSTLFTLDYLRHSRRKSLHGR